MSRGAVLDSSPLTAGICGVGLGKEVSLRGLRIDISINISAKYHETQFKANANRAGIFLLEASWNADIRRLFPTEVRIASATKRDSSEKMNGSYVRIGHLLGRPYRKQTAHSA
jgi:hypothetical protein